MIAVSLFWIISILAQVSVIVRILLRPNREPASRIAWIAVVATIPVLGVVGYLLLGETNVGRRNRKAMSKAIENLPRPIAVDVRSSVPDNPAA